jgi:hypothetical protein
MVGFLADLVCRRLDWKYNRSRRYVGYGDFMGRHRFFTDGGKETQNKFAGNFKSVISNYTTTRKLTCAGPEKNYLCGHENPVSREFDLAADLRRGGGSSHWGFWKI